MWQPQLKALTARWRVLSLRYTRPRGTDAPKAAYTLDQLADDAQALLRALGIQRTHWVGPLDGRHDRSDARAQSAGALREPHSLRYIEPDSARGQALWDERIHTAETKGMDPLVEGTLSRWFTTPFKERGGAVVETVRGMIRSTPPAGYIGCCQAISGLNLTDRIGAIKAPTLIIVGEDDQGTPVAASRVMNERIQGSQLVILTSAAHLSNMEQPDAFTSAPDRLPGQGQLARARTFRNRLTDLRVDVLTGPGPGRSLSGQTSRPR